MARRGTRAQRGGVALRSAAAVALVVGGGGLVGWSVVRDQQPDRDPNRDPDVVTTPAGSMEPVTIHAARPAPATGAPTRLQIPSLGVDAPVIRIGVVDGVLIPPDDPQVLGWWSDGAKPGAVRGGALVTGHTVHDGGGQLDDLERVHLGDPVRVRTGKGVLDYRVSMVRTYRKATLARDAQEVFSQTGPGRLVVVTCEDWDGTKYLSNVVVYADPRPTA